MLRTYVAKIVGLGQPKGILLLDPQSSVMEFSKKRITSKELEEAFFKLQSFVYFDNYDLILRGRVAEFKINLRENLEKLNADLKGDGTVFKSLAKRASLSFLPKSLQPNNPAFKANFYTNSKDHQSNIIDKPQIFCDFPIEYHLIAVVWLIRYGAKVDGCLSKNAWGNRLVLINDQTQLAPGRSLFKPYVKQFQRWWSNAIDEAKMLLKKGENATVINFDLRSFYHEVDFNFDALEAMFPFLSGDLSHELLREIHVVYKQLLLSVRKSSTKGSGSKANCALPIGLLTSHVLANWYLRELDQTIEKELIPHYYGRYVDDVLIVVKDSIIEGETLKSVMAENPGLDQIAEDQVINFYIKKYLSDILNINDSDIKLSIPSLENLKLNRSKLFIYQFDAKHSPNLIEKFVDEQKERASMFKFLSDEADEFFDDFEKITFESNFNDADVNNAKFKNLEDNKYKLSSFFSKIIKKRIHKGKGYRDEEVDKILKFFKGRYLIKNYFFWEKLLTLLVVYDRQKEFGAVYQEIYNEINDLLTDSSDDFKVDAGNYQRTLHTYLSYAVSMAVSLKPLFIQNPDVVKALTQDPVIFFDEKFVHNSGEDLTQRFRIFRNAGLVRGNFIYHDLLQFTDLSMQTNIDLTSERTIFHRSKLFKSSFLEIQEFQQKFIPFRVKFWQVALLMYYKNLIDNTPRVSNNKKRWLNDSYFSGDILNAAFELFMVINRIEHSRVKDNYFKLSYSEPEGRESSKPREKQFFKDRFRNFFIQEVNVPNGGIGGDKVRIAIVNKYVKMSNFERSLEGNPDRSPDIEEVFDRILDDVSQVKDCDFFVMPELALPHRLIHSYTRQSQRSQIGFTTGIEHLNIQDIGFNFILTVLPINIEGERDAVPVLRLKNHYAPEEELWIGGKRIVVPKPNPYRYDLFIWRGFYFSSYYCFELADVFHRSALFSKVDAIFAPVWNVDTHYYNYLVDSATRDMHNYFVLVNTSQYGFSRISRPRGHVDKEKVIVKGGTEVEYPYTLLVGDLKIAQLRKFQLLDFSAQKGESSSKSYFKPTPPDFILKDVKRRIAGKGIF